MKKTIIFTLFLMLLISCTKLNDKEEIIEEDEVVVLDKKTVSFNAVGDNLIHGAIYADPIANNDYRGVYELVKPYVKEADVSFINQETVLGGLELGLQSYPMFNSPQEIGDAVVDAGFDWVNHATNHSLDMREAGVVNSLAFWDKYPEVKVTGIARSNEEANKAKIIERDGVKFGLLAYRYGTNGIPIPEGKDYLVNLIDKDKIEKDVKELEKKVDSILVSMHWGVEYQLMYNEEQSDLAQFLADLNVDVVIGHHPPVIQPIEYVEGKDGNQTLVIYSLGNFLSGQDQNYRLLGGLASFDIEFDPNTNETKVINPGFMPIITYYNKSLTGFKLYPLKNFTSDLASSHYLSNSDLSYEFFKSVVDDVMSEKIKIDY